MQKQVIAMLTAVAVMNCLGACGVDEGAVNRANLVQIAYHKGDLVGRGFARPILIDDQGFDKIYSASFGKCKIRIWFDGGASGKGTFYYEQKPGSKSYPDPSAASLKAMKLTALKGC